MRNNRGVSPLIATLLLIAITVGITTMYATVATDIVDVYGSEDYVLPNINVDEDEGQISAQLLDKGEMSTVVIESPNESGINDIYLETVGERKSFTVADGDTGTYSISARNSDGSTVLLENIQVAQSADDSVEDLSLVLLNASVEGGEDSISFELRNTGDEEVSITEYMVETVNLNDIEINTRTPPSRRAGNSESEILIDSTPRDGYCGLQPPKKLPIDEISKFTNCKAGSEPSVAASGATLETTFNGVDADKSTNYIGISPDPNYTDVAINLYGPKDESIRVPLTFDTFVIPKDDSYVYDRDISPSDFQNDPGTILVREDTLVESEIDGFQSALYLTKNTTLGDEVQNIRDVTGENQVKLNDDVSNLEGGIFLGSNSIVSSISNVDYFTIREDSTVRGEVDNIAGSVLIGQNSVVRDEMQNINDELTIEDNVEIQDEIDNINNDLSIGSDSFVNSISNVGGELSIGSNAEIVGEIEGIGSEVSIGENSIIKDEIDNIGGDLTLGEGTTANSQIDNIGGDLILEDGVSVNANIKNINGEVICGEDVETQTNEC